MTRHEWIHKEPTAVQPVPMYQDSKYIQKLETAEAATEKSANN